MSTDVNPARATPRRVLFVLANPATSPTTGWPIGFWAAEFTHPYWEFTEAGYEVEVCSPDGGDLLLDGYSDPRHESGYSAHDLVSLGFLSSPRHAAMLKATPRLADMDLGRYDAVFVAGGQSPMVTFIDNQPLHRFLAAAYEAGKISRTADCSSRAGPGPVSPTARRLSPTASSASASSRSGSRTRRARFPTPTSSSTRSSAPSPCATAGSSPASSSARARRRHGW